MHKIQFYIGLCFLLSGCMLDDVVEHGQECPRDSISGSIAYINDETCTRDNCPLGDFSVAFNTNVCPSKYPSCGFENNKYYCSKLSCQSDQHVYKSNCENDDLNNCGRHDNVCSDLAGWAGGNCIKGICQPDECQDNYELKDGKCVAASIHCDEETQFEYQGKCVDNTTEHCGNINVKCTENEAWVSGICQNSRCYATECKEGYIPSKGNCISCMNGHLYNDACELNDTDNCGEHGKTCTSESGTTSCQSGECIIKECSDDFHIYDNTCEPDSIENCGEHGNKCNTANAVNICEGQKCKYSCNKGFHMTNGTCEADSNDNCGASGISCKVENGNASCRDGVCIIECNKGFHSMGQTCEPDNTQNCGGTQCNVPNAVSNCFFGQCRFDCLDGYHIYNDGCEIDNSSNCGSHGNDCTYTNGTGQCISGSCSLSSCTSGYHIYNNACEKDDISNCGSHGNACSYANGTAQCTTSGSCSLKSCDSNYHKYNNTCEKNSLSNCGEHGAACSFENGSGQCSATGACTLSSCNTGYHKYNGACEKDSNTNCGAHGNKCLSVQSCSGGECTCPEGKVLNYNNTACILKTCQNIPGVREAVKCYENQCLPTKCANGFKLDGTDCTTPIYESYAQCIPLCDTDDDCRKIPGQSKIKCSVYGHCYTAGMVCDSGYHIYSMACMPNDNCCGDTCQNCKAYGKTCVSGKCQ